MERIMMTGGTFFDGSGSDPKPLDVLIEGGKVRQLIPRGRSETLPNVRQLDVSGCWVMPGFLDTHTHYDAELAISPGLTESVRHGVTSVIVGSCSVSFVASEAEDCSDMFTRVESVPRQLVLPLLQELKQWNRPQGWRDWVDRHPLGPNVSTYLGHSDMRCRAMGFSRSVDPTARPSADELKTMTTLLHEALDCGFLGMSAMTNPWDRLDGNREWSKSLPSYYARGAERKVLQEVLRARGGIHQTAPNLVTRLNILGIAWASAAFLRKPLRTTLITMMDVKADRYIFRLTSTLAWLANRLLRGDFRWQSPPVPFDLYYDGMDSVLFEEFPTGQAVRHLAYDPQARTALLKTPAYRKAFRQELNKRLSPRVWHRDLGDTVILEAPDPSLVGKSFTQVATERHADPIDTFLDLMLEHDRALRWHTCLANDRPEKLEELLRHPGTLISFSDAGAHLRNMAFYNFPVRMLKKVYDAERAGKPIMSLGQAVHRLTGELADWFGLDAGHLYEGARADVTVLDPQKLTDQVEKLDFAPFPGMPDFKRLVNQGDAVRTVLVGGVPVVEEGKPLPRLGKERTGCFLACRHLTPA